MLAAHTTGVHAALVGGGLAKVAEHGPHTFAQFQRQAAPDGSVAVARAAGVHAAHAAHVLAGGSLAWIAEHLPHAFVQCQ